MSTTVSVTDLHGDDLRYRIGEVPLLDGVSVRLRAGTITGLLGPNGSGKSTLLRLIVGALPPSAGALAIAEDGALMDLGAMRRRDRAQRIALVEQSAHAEVPLRVRDVVALGRIPHERRFSGADLTGDIVEEAMSRAGVSEFADRSFDTLSGGEQQRVHLARALAQQPRVLLLDEPTNHLDLAAQLAMVQVLREIAERGVAVLIALHDLTQAADLCDEVVVLDSGTITAAGSPEQVLSPALIGSVWGVHGEWVRGERGRALVISPL